MFVDVGHHDDGLGAGEVDPVPAIFGLDLGHTRLVPVPLVYLTDRMDNFFPDADLKQPKQSISQSYY